jgi:putative tricarboxylic transport membrane protein
VKLHDALWGALLVVFAGALFVHVQGFPAMPGQRVGPGALPGALAVGLFVCGALLLVRGLRERARDGAARWIELPEWFASAPQVRGMAVLVGVNLLYVFAVDRLGFIVTGVVYLAALMWVLRVRLARALPIAVVMTLLIHYAFYKLLKVPLPWGVLQPVAW